MKHCGKAIIPSLEALLSKDCTSSVFQIDIQGPERALAGSALTFDVFSQVSEPLSQARLQWEFLGQSYCQQAIHTFFSQSGTIFEQGDLSKGNYSWQVVQKLPRNVPQSYLQVAEDEMYVVYVFRVFGADGMNFLSKTFNIEVSSYPNKLNNEALQKNQLLLTDCEAPEWNVTIPSLLMPSQAQIEMSLTCAPRDAPMDLIDMRISQRITRAGEEIRKYTVHHERIPLSPPVAVGVRSSYQFTLSGFSLPFSCFNIDVWSSELLFEVSINQKTQSGTCWVVLGPLEPQDVPFDWERRRDMKGHIYYAQHSTKKTHWHLPLEVISQSIAQKVALEFNNFSEFTGLNSAGSPKLLRYRSAEKNITVVKQELPAKEPDTRGTYASDKLVFFGSDETLQQQFDGTPAPSYSLELVEGHA